MAKIAKPSDYYNPKNLWSLRNCNIEYGKAHKKFKERKYKDAKDNYETYIKEYNSVDWDAYYELALCYLHLSIPLKDDEEIKYLKQAKKHLEKIHKEKPNNKRYYRKFLEISDVYTKRKAHRDIDHKLPLKLAEASNDELKQFRKEILGE